jgi:hypothetical protein
MRTKQNTNEFNKYMNSYRSDEFIQACNSKKNESHAYKTEHE